MYIHKIIYIYTHTHTYTHYLYIHIHMYMFIDTHIYILYCIHFIEYTKGMNIHIQL